MTALRDEYADPSPLQVRLETHARHSEIPDDPVAAVVRALRLTGCEALADIGCGDARFLARLVRAGHSGRLAGADTSRAMVAAAAALPGVSGVLADATALPFADAEFDCATARHMLYHVADPSLAVGELARITRPGGRIAVTVNHPAPCARTRELVAARARDHGLHPAPELANSVNSATLPTLLAGVLTDLEIHRHDNALVFDTPAPLLRFAEALFSFAGVGVDSPARDDIRDAVTADVLAWFDAHPGEAWRDPKGYAVAVGTVPA